MKKSAAIESRAQVKRVLFACLHESGKLLKQSIHKLKKIDYKSEANLVTQIDKLSEKLILKRIKRSFPDHAILAEESEPHGNSRCKWIIDPLDGTTNFAHTYPVSCVSIGYEEDGKVVLGGVYDPYRDELFFAERGKGAFLNGKRIHASKAKNLKESLLCTGFPYDRHIFASTYLKIFGKFMIASHGIRRTGSAAIDICYVACGRFDGFWELKLNPWDTAAASLVCQEAGGKISDFAGNPYSVYQFEALASNSLIHKEMLNVLARTYERPKQ